MMRDSKVLVYFEKLVVHRHTSVRFVSCLSALMRTCVRQIATAIWASEQRDGGAKPRATRTKRCKSILTHQDLYTLCLCPPCPITPHLIATSWRNQPTMMQSFA